MGRFDNLGEGQNKARASEGGTGNVGRVGLSFFLLFFSGIGMTILVFMLSEIHETASAYSWDKADCVIEQSDIAENQNVDSPFTVQVRYRYTYKGSTYFSTQIAKDSSTFSDYSDAQRLKLKYATNKTVECYINPSKPTEAILQHGSLWLISILILPLIFVVFGVGGLYMTWFHKSKKGVTESISKESVNCNSTMGRYGLALFFFIFFAVGASVGYFIVFRPLAKSFAADSWILVPAVVESSRVRTHDGEDGNTYSVDILYSYSIDGILYKSNAYDFFSGSSSGYSGKRDIVRQYPKGKNFDCYVNPSDYIEAVIHPEFDGNMALIGLIPLVFMIIGGGGMYAALTGKMTSGRKSNQPLSNMYSHKTGVEKEASGSFAENPSGDLFQRASDYNVASLNDVPSWVVVPTNYEQTSGSGVVLKPMFSGKAKLVGMCIVAAIWNGIMILSLSDLFGKGGSTFDIMDIVFLSPFLLIGLAMIGGVVYFALALNNPVPTLRLCEFCLRPGKPLRIDWELSGNVSRISELLFTLRGREEARYRRGTSTCTDKETFYEHVVEKSQRPIMPSGSFDITLPRGAMHSFDGGNNNIIWSLEVRGDIKFWPDVHEDFPLIVLPIVEDM